MIRRFLDGLVSTVALSNCVHSNETREIYKPEKGGLMDYRKKCVNHLGVEPHLREIFAFVAPNRNHVDIDVCFRFHTISFTEESPKDCSTKLKNLGLPPKNYDNDWDAEYKRCIESRYWK